MRALTPFALICALLATAPAYAQGNAGEYLAARQAGMMSDYRAAAQYYSRALMRDRANPVLLENGVTAYIGLGDLERATVLADQMARLEVPSQIANLALVGAQVNAADYEVIAEALAASETVGPLFDGLARAWALVGTGSMGEAIEAFDAVSTTPGVSAFGLYHKALALALVGDFEGADALLSGDGGAELRLTRRGLIAHAEVMSQLERNADAIAMIDQFFGTALDPQLAAVYAELQAGQTLPFTAIESAGDGIAEVFYTIAAALETEAQPGFTLLYARMAHMVRDDHVD
ncbi:MAG: hypothetical protein AAFN59_07415, partial [Pseudomonadota bacterium]